MVKHLPTTRETRVQSLRWENLLEKEMVTHFTPGKKIPWTEGPSRLQSMGLQRIWQDWATLLYFIVILQKECQGAGAFCVITVLREICWRRGPRRWGSQPRACRGRDLWLEESKGAKICLYLWPRLSDRFHNLLIMERVSLDTWAIKVSLGYRVFHKVKPQSVTARC